MHKLSVFGLSLVMFLFLAATTSSMPITASAFEMDDARQNYDLYYNGEETYSQVDPYQQSYDYSYEDMYSKYPTKDKKFVCQEGPFKGFFVVKPKFCDVELPAGPQGPPGINGTQGPQGPPGPNQILPSSFYIVNGSSSDTTNSQTATSRADCDSGDVAIGGFASLFVLGGSSLDGVIEVSQGTTPVGEGYFIGVLVQSGTEIIVTSFAKCFDNPPAHVTMAAADVFAFQQPEDAVIMSQGKGNSPQISEVKGDSSELTATEKITKLKIQWLDLLP